MKTYPDPVQIERLEKEHNLWVGTVRPEGRPHLAPVWFVWWEDAIFICISGKSVKARNLAQNDNVVCALEDGSSPIIAEGLGMAIQKPYPAGVVEIFIEKYDWDIRASEKYDLVVKIKPKKWLAW